MANFNFNPPEGLNNTSTFVDEPTTGAAARQQFMTLFNQLKDYVNVLNNQSYPANGGNADTLDGQHAGAFAGSGHLHDDRYSQTNHGHSYNSLSDKPNLVDRDNERWVWSGTVPYNQAIYVTHGLNTIKPLITWESTVGNVNPTIKVENANQLYIGNYNDTGGNSCVITIRIW